MTSWTVVASLYFLHSKPGHLRSGQWDSENSDAGALGMGGYAWIVHPCRTVSVSPAATIRAKKSVLHLVVHCAFPNVVKSQGIKFNRVRLSSERPETMVF